MNSLIKVTDRTELILSLDRDRIYQLVITFRNYCLNKYNDIYPMGYEKEKIDKRFGLSQADNDQSQEIREAVMAHLGYDSKSYEPIDCLVELLRNPRVLKRSLAHTWSAWQALHGEIYFDDLLVVHTIRAALPKLYEILATNIRVFRLFINQKSKHDNKKLYDLTEHVFKEYEIVDGNLYHQLIKFLFPGWNIPSESQAEKLTSYMFADEPHPQGIAQSHPSDYFYRLNSEETSGEDQGAMQNILDYNIDSISKERFIEQMRDDHKYSKRVEHFGKLFKPEKVLDLTSAYFATIKKYDYIRFADFDLLGMLRKIHRKNSTNEQNHQKWLEEMLSVYLPISIRFANDIFNFWKFRKDSDADNNEYRPEIRRMYHDLIKTQFNNEPGKLINALVSEPEHIWTLRHLLFNANENKAIRAYDQKKTFFSYWQPWFIDLLVKAAKINPKLIAMHTVPLVYDIQETFMDNSDDIDDIDDSDDNKQRNSHGWKSNFDEEIASLLFVDKLPEIMRIISALSEEDYVQYNMSEQATSILDFAIVHSKKWTKNSEK